MPDPGYLAADGHQQRRRAWVAHFAAGGSWACRKCGRTINPGEPWDLGHGRELVRGGTGEDSEPEHPYCNRSAGGKLGNHRRNQPRASRRW